MGLDLAAKGLDEAYPDIRFNMGYMRYFYLLEHVSRILIGDEMTDFFVRAAETHHIYTKAEAEWWNSQCNDGLDLLLFHSDCDGKFTPKECRKVYNAIKDVNLDDDASNAQLNKLKVAFHYCAKRRVNLYYI